MKQSKRMSLIEAVTNVAVGYGLALLTQVLLFPFFDLYPDIHETIIIGGVFTVVSIIRSFLLRRVFEAIRHNASKSKRGR